MKTITLSIATTYVQHWDLWEAVRELLQNALDAKAKGYSMEFNEVTDDFGLRSLHIINGGPALSKASLLLGRTTKSGDNSQIGKFGEGFKLALLVLARKGYQVYLKTGSEKWTPRLGMSEEFDSEVLMIDVEECEPVDGVAVVIEGACEEDLDGKYRPDLPLGRPLSELPGKVFVEGLFVCNLEGYKYGYNLPANRIRLDRDRGTVDGFDIGYETSRIWSQIVDNDPVFGNGLLLRLVNDGINDVRYVECHVPKSSNVEAVLVTHYTSQHKDAIPVSTQDEVKMVIASGKKWQLVPDQLKNILWRAVGYFIPSIGTPKQRLESFVEKYQHSLNESQIAELKDIVEAMQ